MICVSDETAPNRCRSSSNVSATSSSGTGCPSLNRRGSRISKRRDELLIGRRAFDAETDSFHRQGGQGGLRDERFSACPALEREPPGQVTQGTAFRRGIRKANEDHVGYRNVFPPPSQSRWQYE